MRTRTTLIAAVTIALATSGAGAGVAAATPGPTPDQGLTGACNMTNTNASFGMFTIAANTPAAGKGFTGMISAIVNSDGGTAPKYCPAPQ
jgi:hypothetical protein